MKTKRTNKPTDDTVKIIAGVILATISIIGIIFTFLAFVDLPLTRKVLFGLIAFFSWLLLELFSWKIGRTKDKRKTSWSLLLDLIVSVRNEVDPESKRIFQKELFVRIGRWSLIILMVIIVIAGIYKALEDWANLIIEPPAPTSTSTQSPLPTLRPANTLLPTLTFEPLPSPTYTPVAQGHYYMIVLDASASMNETFDGRSRWDAAQGSLRVILEVLDVRSNYGLIVVGGSDSSGLDDPCSSRGDEEVEFTSKDQLNSKIRDLQPSGGGSYSAAFNLAVSILRQQPDDALKKIYFITGPSDDCQDRDEWEDIETASFEIPADLYGGIIIMDEKSSYRPIEFAKRMQERANINVQVPNSNETLQHASEQTVKETIVIINNHATEVAPTPQEPTHTLAPTRTPSPRPTQTPANTMTVFPTFTPTGTFTPTTTKTATPIPASPTATPCQSGRQKINTGALAGTATIGFPVNCSTGYTSGTPLNTTGTYSGTPQDSVIWVFVYPPNGPYYPQSPSACEGTSSPPPNQSGGSWNVPSYLGNVGVEDSQKWFDIVVVVADQSASNSIGDMLHADCLAGEYDGISANALSALNVSEKASITVKTK